jgi:hypothetical protein
MANSNLTNAKKAKNDEFYTQFSDIQKEVESYLEYDPNTFKGKVVYSNCDDPFESNFFRYFVLNFNRLGLKRLISTSYKPSPVANSQLGLFGDDKTLPKSKGRPKITANKFIINEVGDIDGDGSFTLKDIAKQLKANKNNEWTPLESDGDFRSDECVELLKQSDIVVTNPPFSLFRQYVAQLVENKKLFLIIGNLNGVKYKEIFPYIQKNKIWLGNNYKVNGGAMLYEIPENVANLEQVKEIKTSDNGDKKYITRVPNVRWFTNLLHGRLHQPLKLMSMEDNLRYNKKILDKNPYRKYDNYDAIEVPYVDAIPNNYKGVMGVPISVLDKHCVEQFEIVGLSMKYGFGLESDKLYDSYKEIRPNGTFTGSSGRKTNGNPMIEGKHEKNNYYVDGKGNCAYSLFDRIFIKHKKK